MASVSLERKTHTSMSRTDRVASEAVSGEGGSAERQGLV